METNGQRPSSILVALGILALLGLGIYWFCVFLIDKLNSVNSDLGKAIVAAGAASADGDTLRAIRPAE